MLRNAGHVESEILATFIPKCWPRWSEIRTQHSLHAQGILLSTLGLQQRDLGAEVLRELARPTQMAAAETLREVRRDDRQALGWHRRLLQAREQSGPGIRRGTQQQDPRLSTPRLRATRRGVSAAQGAHVHAAGALKS